MNIGRFMLFVCFVVGSWWRCGLVEIMLAGCCACLRAGSWAVDWPCRHHRPGGNSRAAGSMSAVGGDPRARRSPTALLLLRCLPLPLCGNGGGGGRCSHYLVAVVVSLCWFCRCTRRWPCSTQPRTSQVTLLVGCLRWGGGLVAVLSVPRFHACRV